MISERMQLARNLARNSPCLRRKVGALLLDKDGGYLSLGWNQPPGKCHPCTSCMREFLDIESGTRQELCRAIHAEADVIGSVAAKGVPTHGSSLYVTHQPCGICAKLLIKAGVKEIYFEEPYPDSLAEELFLEAGVKLIQVEVDTEGKEKYVI